MPKKDCNIIHSSEELEKSYLLQNSRTEVDEHEKNLQAKGSAQSYLSVFPGLDRKKENLSCSWGVLRKANWWLLLPEHGQRLIDGSHMGYTCFNSPVFEYPSDLIDFLKFIKSAVNSIWFGTYLFRADLKKRLKWHKNHTLKNFRTVCFNPRRPKTPQLSKCLKYFYNICVTSRKNISYLKIFCIAYPIPIYMIKYCGLNLASSQAPHRHPLTVPSAGLGRDWEE